MRATGKFLAILLSITLIIGLLPAVPSPSGADLAEDTALAGPDTGMASAPATLLGEDTARRDKYTKHFRMSDGSIVAAVYPEAVHFLKDGVWTEVDNSLTETTDASGKAVLENRDNSYRVTFAKRSDSGKLVKLSFNGYGISWGIEQGRTSSAEDTTKTAAKQTIDAGPATGMETANTKSCVTYAGILDGTDLQYVSKADEVKESIILNSASAQNTISFLYRFDGLQPVLNKDGSITLLDAATLDDTGMSIAAPYMMDAGDACSDAIAVTLDRTGKDEYRITLTADREWLDAKDRVYPVTIDPTLQTTANVPDIRDTFITDEFPNTVLNMEPYTKIGNQNSSGHEYIEYIKYRVLPDLKSSDQVVDARLVLYPYYIMTGTNSLDNPFSPKPIINAYKVTGAWESETLTYNTTPRPAAESVVLDYEVVDGNADDVATRAYVV